MSSIELLTFLAGASVALSVAVGVAMAVMPGVSRAVVAVGCLAVSGAAYSLLPLPAVVQSTEELRWALRAVACCGVPLLWLVLRFLFDGVSDARPALVGSAGVVLLVALASAWPGLRPLWLGALSVGLAGFVVHMLWHLAGRRRDDLDEFRRRMRTALALACVAYVALVLVVCAAGLRRLAPVDVAAASIGAQTLFKLFWLALAVGQPSPWRRVLDVARAPEPPVQQDLSTVGEHRSSVNQALAARQAEYVLDTVRREALYRRHGLGIGELATIVELPEHRLRSVINGHLGFKNFAAFLNHFRLREAAERLRDPAFAHLPVLTIAMDAGFASIGPFNRAFRDAFGATPTDYRRAAASPSDA
ncbi:AraC family transcriptional regulator [Piscinibacter sp. HJYY11]|uniref:helix-turn-helix domain-containing protein n=1 Tax=Piscinibacter sp. HJYY11 TaxID=2801333 RepID=UPI00192019F7|nr:AraC family transcriptional regulator [Piscinibacter sp. HJYY11]MBL0728287.1 helix-turn-helix transcriptional regulator [Piscinibacter sp. HJYY11]